MPKRRSPGDGGLYFDHARGLWRAVVDMGFTADGRRKQKAVTSKSQAKAREKLRVVQAELAANGGVLPSKVTVQEWVAYYLEHIGGRRLKPNTYTAYAALLSKWVVPKGF